MYIIMRRELKCDVLRVTMRKILVIWLSIVNASCFISTAKIFSEDSAIYYVRTAGPGGGEVMSNTQLLSL